MAGIDIDLRPWQQLVFNEILGHEEYVNRESIQAMSDFDQNRSSAIQANFRRGSGHSLLTAYLARYFATTVMYFDLNHYKELEILGEIKKGKDEFDVQSKFISVYELRHVIVDSIRSPTGGGALASMKVKFFDQSAIVIDRATEVKEKYPEVIEFIFQVARLVPIVLLG